MPTRPKTFKPRSPIPTLSIDEAEKFYRSAPWRKCRAAYLMGEPLCEECKSTGQITEATIVHHIRPYREAPHLGLVFENLQSLCHRHHEAKHERFG